MTLLFQHTAMTAAPRLGLALADGHVCELAASHSGLEQIILPLLAVWRELRRKVAGLSNQLVRTARQSEQCQLLASIPGIGAVTACSFIAAIEDPANFARSRSVGAWLGLTTKRYQSGEVDYDGHISRRGDAYVRGLLYEAATVMLTRAHADSELRRWGLKLREKIGLKRAAIAVARKLSVIMHAMLNPANPSSARQCPQPEHTATGGLPKGLSHSVAAT